MDSRRASRLGQRLRDIDAEAGDCDVVADAQARGILERGVVEIVERVAEVRERRDSEVTWQVTHDLHRAGGEIARAVRLAFLVDGQLVEREAADAAFAAGKETLRG